MKLVERQHTVMSIDSVKKQVIDCTDVFKQESLDDAKVGVR